MNLADPMTHNEAELDAKADEALREQLWADFLTWATDARVSVLLKHVADLMDGQRDPYHYGVAQQPLLDFAETEGWSGVLSALARVQAFHESSFALAGPQGAAGAR